MHSDKLKGIAVVSTDEGARIGRVEESLFDPQDLHLAAFRIKGDNGTFIVPLDKVQGIGADAVMVANSAATQVTAADSTLVGWQALQKRKVVDETGTLLGTVNDMDVDTTTGLVVVLIVHKGGMLGFGGETIEVQATRIKSVGAELITLQA